MKKKTFRDFELISIIAALPDEVELWKAAERTASIIKSGGGYEAACNASGMKPELFSRIMQTGAIQGNLPGFSHFFAVVMSAISGVAGFEFRFKPAGGYVYLVRDTALGMTKIGSATDYRSRVGGLQTACPQELHLIAVIQSDKYIGIERELHAKYSDKRYRGEWFSLTDEDIDAIVTYHDGRYLLK